MNFLLNIITNTTLFFIRMTKKITLKRKIFQNLKLDVYIE